MAPPLWFSFLVGAVCFSLLLFCVCMAVRFWNVFEDLDLEAQKQQTGRYTPKTILRNAGPFLSVATLFAKAVSASPRSSKVKAKQEGDDNAKAWNSKTSLLAPGLLPQRKSAVVLSCVPRLSDPLCEELVVPECCQCSLLLPSCQLPSRLKAAAARTPSATLELANCNTTGGVDGRLAEAAANRDMCKVAVSTMWGSTIFDASIEELPAGQGTIMRVGLEAAGKVEAVKLAFIEAPVSGASEHESPSPVIKFFRKDGTLFGTMSSNDSVPDSSPGYAAAKAMSLGMQAECTLKATGAYEDIFYSVQTEEGDSADTIVILRCLLSNKLLKQIIAYDSDGSYLCTCDAKLGGRVVVLSAGCDVGLLVLAIFGVEHLQRVSMAQVWWQETVATKACTDYAPVCISTSLREAAADSDDPEVDGSVYGLHFVEDNGRTPPGSREKKVEFFCREDSEGVDNETFLKANPPPVTLHIL